MKRPALRAQIRHLCCLGLPSEVLMPRLLPLLRHLVPADSAGFFWVDSSGHMQNLYAERMLNREHMKLYFERFYDSAEHLFQRQFMQRVRKGETVTATSPDTAFQRSEYYNEILRNLDAHHVMSGIVCTHGNALGQLSLYRPKKSIAFDAHDETELASVLHYVGHAVSIGSNGIQQTSGGSAHMLSGHIAQHVDTQDEAIAMVDADSTILHASDLARRLLIQAANGTFAPMQMQIADESCTALIHDLIVRLEKNSNMPPVITRHSRWGRMILRAYSLDEAAQNIAPIAIRITRQEPLLLRFSEAVKNVGLPPQQQEIMLHLARGKTNQEIASEMAISYNTVSYHVKQIFHRLDAHSRDEALSKVMTS